MKNLSEPAPPSGRGVGGCISGLEPDGPGSTPGALTISDLFDGVTYVRGIDVEDIILVDEDEDDEND